ncbi:MAG: hypothetical protein JZU47_10185 [Prolixibacteraceae bacterium]|nr:hypothetical protein [Prolixibacteraceae bacterium]
MNIHKTDYHDLIEQYLDGKLTEEENSNFQHSLSTNAELSEQFQVRIKLAENWTRAKEYGNIRQLISESIREAKLEKKNRLFVWSIAASFLVLLSASGILMLTDRDNKQVPMAKNDKKIESQYVPKLKQAEEKASVHFMGELKLISPVQGKICNRNDSIVFLWISDIDATTNLTIENQKNGKTIYRKKISIVAKRFVLEKDFLPEGEYSWYIEGFQMKEKFKVISSEVKNKD